MAGDPQDAARAVSAIAAPAGGRLLVVSPTGLRGSPWEGEFLDGVEVDGAAVVVSLGDGHAVYRLERVGLVETGPGQARLSAAVLTTTSVPYGRTPRPASTQHFTDAELLVTSSSRVAAAATRTKGTPVGGRG